MLYMLDKYKNKVHIIDPQETTLGEFQKEKVDMHNLDPFQADRILQEKDQAKKKIVSGISCS